MQSPVSVIVVPEVDEAVHTVRMSTVAAEAGVAVRIGDPATATPPTAATVNRRRRPDHRPRGRRRAGAAVVTECDAPIIIM
ncbi:hypothetical protein GCM10010195_21340 [Kitasatospora griseola]|nr:hypothetical protein GCM10010195_21340 [Kitasatospora griseola]